MIASVECLDRWRFHVCRAFAFVVVISAALFTSARVASADSAALWELDPYRVRILLAIEGPPAVQHSLTESIVPYVESMAAREMGAAWQLTVESADKPLRESLLRERFPAVDVLAETWRELADKVLLVAVAKDRWSWRVVARELDTSLKHYGRATTLHIEQPELMPPRVWHAVLDSFRPLAIVADVKGQKVQLRRRAADLVEETAYRALSQVGDVLQPVVQSFSRDGKSRNSPLEWTLLKVQQSEGGKAQANMFSGYRSPIGGRSGLSQTLAIVSRPSHAKTKLTIVATGGSEPLPGYELHLQHPPQSTTETVGQTNYRGQVDIPPVDGGFCLLIVKNGSEVLCRVPIQPGVEPAAKLTLPDDRKRLEAEGLTIALQERVVDLVAQRQILLVDARAKIEAGQLADAAQLLKKVRQLSVVEPLLAEIRSQRQRLQTSDPYVKGKITRLFDDTEKVLTTYFDLREIVEVETTLDRKKKEAEPAKT